MSSLRPDLLDFARKQTAELEHERNLRGKTRLRCKTCDGVGHMRDGYVDYDGYGSSLVAPTSCADCRGQCAFEVDCEPSKQLAAIDREIAKLRELKRRVRKKTSSSKGFYSESDVRGKSAE